MKAKRNPNGTYKPWGKKDDKGKYGSWHGTKTHIGKQYAKEKGRPAAPGELYRDKNQDGSFNKNAVCWVYTDAGWKHLNRKWAKEYNIDLKGKKLKGGSKKTDSKRGKK